MQTATKKRRGYWTEAKAREALAELSQSKLSDAAFARERGISTQRLLFWRKRLTQPPTPPAPAFVPVVVAATTDEDLRPGSPVAMIEIMIGDVTLRVREQASPSTVAELVRALVDPPTRC